MRIDYHNLHEGQFEDLAIAICKKILGGGTQKFAQGPDGGRDGKFNGTASLFPSQNHPYSGKFIIQAKLTHNPIGKFSDYDFYSKSKTCVINTEINRIKDLIANDGIDHYILFTNRRQSANKSEEIEKKLIKLGLKSVTLIGLENLDLYLKEHPSVLKIADINFYDSPLRIFPDDLAEIIVVLRDEIKKITSTKFDKEEFKRIKFDDKCKLNTVSNEYKKVILSHLSEFDKIDQFLAMPANADQQDLYIQTAETFNTEVLERISNVSLESLLNSFWHRLVYRDPDLKKNNRLTRTVLYYMFWKCDLGKKNAETQ
jgi:hypothetical protein